MKYLGFIRANLQRNKLRTALTGGAITLAVALVCLLLTMPAGLDALVEQLANNTRISVHNKAGIVYSMPYAFTRKVRLLSRGLQVSTTAILPAQADVPGPLALATATPLLINRG